MREPRASTFRCATRPAHRRKRHSKFIAPTGRRCPHASTCACIKVDGIPCGPVLVLVTTPAAHLARQVAADLAIQCLVQRHVAPKLLVVSHAAHRRASISVLERRFPRALMRPSQVSQASRASQASQALATRYQPSPHLLCQCLLARKKRRGYFFLTRVRSA